MNSLNRGYKVVIIGDSGVGKTSIRGQYISRRFTNTYKATIGTDFISKTLPHHSKPGESTTLQIWDTAGQERFSSLSIAFFRGADAAILVYDVNRPETLRGLRRWWGEFKDRAPVPDDEVKDYCCVVVGNKMDLSTAHEETSEGWSSENWAPAVTHSDAEAFLRELIPPSTREGEVEQCNGNGHPPALDEVAPSSPIVDPGSPPVPQSPKTQSILINRTSSSSHSQLRPNGHGRHPEAFVNLPSSSSFDRSQHFGTMTSTRSKATIYHTPSSSFHNDEFASAPSTPDPPSEDEAEAEGDPSSPDSHLRATRRIPSASSNSSTPTITPSLFHRNHSSSSAVITPPTPDVDSLYPRSTSSLPPRPERGPKLFLTSAKTGEGVSPVFEYIAKRLTMRSEYQSAVDARTMHVRDGTTDTIRLSSSKLSSKSVFSRWSSNKASCCG